MLYDITITIRLINCVPHSSTPSWSHPLPPEHSGRDEGPSWLLRPRGWPAHDNVLAEGWPASAGVVLRQGIKGAVPHTGGCSCGTTHLCEERYSHSASPVFILITLPVFIHITPPVFIHITLPVFIHITFPFFIQVMFPVFIDITLPVLIFITFPVYIHKMLTVLIHITFLHWNHLAVRKESSELLLSNQRARCWVPRWQLWRAYWQMLLWRAYWQMLLWRAYWQMLLWHAYWQMLLWHAFWQMLW